jgi:hypothetical protein
MLSKKHAKRSSTSLIISKYKSKSQRGSSLHSLGGPLSRKNNEQIEIHLHYSWDCKTAWPLWKTVWRALKKKRNRITICYDLEMC